MNEKYKAASKEQGNHGQTTIIRKLKVAWGFSWQQKLWFVVLYPLSGLVRAAVLTIPFKHLNRALGKNNKNHRLSSIVSEEQLLTAKNISIVIRTVSKYTPWTSNCMVEAMLARFVLRAYGIPYVFYLGVQMTHDPEEPMKAHAWVTAGPYAVVGGKNHHKFGVVGTFI